jgi:hypothetical protein
MTSDILIVPDVHQDYLFLEALEAEQSLERFQRVIFLGDFIDAKRSLHDNKKSFKKTLKFIKKLREHLGDKLVLIPGNHDLPYFGARPNAAGTGLLNPDLARYGCGPVEPDYLRSLTKHWEPAIWDSFVPAHYENGWLFSHAGISLTWWKDLADDLDSPAVFMASLQAIWDEAKQGAFSSLFEAGPARGGFAAGGGIFWLDFHEEFNDDLPFPQIVGHTSGSFARRNGRSWCLDARQSVYAILSPDHSLEIIRVKGR